MIAPISGTILYGMIDNCIFGFCRNDPKLYFSAYALLYSIIATFRLLSYVSQLDALIIALHTLSSASLAATLLTLYSIRISFPNHNTGQYKTSTHSRELILTYQHTLSHSPLVEYNNTTTNTNTSTNKQASMASRQNKNEQNSAGNSLGTFATGVAIGALGLGVLHYATSQAPPVRTWERRQPAESSLGQAFLEGLARGASREVASEARSWAADEAGDAISSFLFGG